MTVQPVKRKLDHETRSYKKRNLIWSQQLVFCRYVNSSGPKEEMIEVLPLKGQTHGEDISEAFLDCLETKEINTSHFVSIATDGAPNEWGTTRVCEFTLEVAEYETVVILLYLTQRGFVRSNFPSECKEIMNLIIRIVNKIMAQELNHQQFHLVLNKLESIYLDLRLHNNFQWLSKGEMLKWFAMCLSHTKIFQKIKGLTFSEMDQPDCMQKLHFMVNTTAR